MSEDVYVYNFAKSIRIASSMLVMLRKKLYEAIYVYSDSTAFPRSSQVAPTETWPILLNKISNSVYLRGKGGVESGELLSILREDLYYFNLNQISNHHSLVIFAFGIVDCAPRPMTYKLKVINRLPLFGPKLWTLISKALKPHRAWIQKISSYQVTSAAKFRRNLEKMLKLVTNPNSLIAVLGTPIPSDEVIRRSPGLKEAVFLYNKIKEDFSIHSSRTIFIPINLETSKSYVSPEDGHHFSKSGHQAVADTIIRYCADFEKNSNRKVSKSV